MNLNLSRAALIGAAFFFEALGAQATSMEFKETPKDLIAKAQHLILQKDRLKATRVLKQGVEAKAYSFEERQRLKSELKKVSEIVLTDKGQQLFQVAETLYYSGDKASAGKYQEALKIEPYNLQFLKGLVRAQLGQKNCGAARQNIQKGYDVFPYDMGLKLYQGQALICLGRPEEADQHLNALKPLSAHERLYQNTLLAQAKINMKTPAEALGYLKKAYEIDPQYPRLHYGLWEAESPNNGLKTKAARTYSKLCKALNAPLRRKYKFDPSLCEFVVEVNEFLAPQTGS